MPYTGAQRSLRVMGSQRPLRQGSLEDVGNAEETRLNPQEAGHYLRTCGVLHAFRVFLERTYLEGDIVLDDGYATLYNQAADEMIRFRDEQLGGVGRAYAEDIPDDVQEPSLPDEDGEGEEAAGHSESVGDIAPADHDEPVVHPEKSALSFVSYDEQFGAVPEEGPDLNELYGPPKQPTPSPSLPSEPDKSPTPPEPESAPSQKTESDPDHKSGDQSDGENAAGEDEAESGRLPDETVDTKGGAGTAVGKHTSIARLQERSRICAEQRKVECLVYKKRIRLKFEKGLVEANPSVVKEVFNSLSDEKKAKYEEAARKASMLMLGTEEAQDAGLTIDVSRLHSRRKSSVVTAEQVFFKEFFGAGESPPELAGNEGSSSSSSSGGSGTDSDASERDRDENGKRLKNPLGRVGRKNKRKDMKKLLVARAKQVFNSYAFLQMSTPCSCIDDVAQDISEAYDDIEEDIVRKEESTKDLKRTLARLERRRRPVGNYAAREPPTSEAELKGWLKMGGVDFSTWGKGQTLSVAHLFHNLTHGKGFMRFLPGGQINYEFHLAIVKCTRPGESIRSLVLVETHHMLRHKTKVRVRFQSPMSIVHRDESCHETVSRLMRTELNCDSGDHGDPDGISTSRHVTVCGCDKSLHAVEQVLVDSPDYPGLKCHVYVHIVEVRSHSLPPYAFFSRDKTDSLIGVRYFDWFNEDQWQDAMNLRVNMRTSDPHGSKSQRLQALRRLGTDGNDNASNAEVRWLDGKESNFREEDDKVLRRLFPECSELDVEFVSGGYSGSVVLTVKGRDPDGNPQIPCIAKIDKYEDIERELLNFKLIAEDLGDNAPAVLQTTVASRRLEELSNQNMRAGIRFELAGACWNDPAMITNVHINSLRELFLQRMFYAENDGVPPDKGAKELFGDATHVVKEVFCDIFVKCTYEGRTSSPGNLYTELGIKDAISRYAHGVVPEGRRATVATLSHSTMDLIRRFEEAIDPSMFDGQLVSRAVCHGDLNGGNILIDALEYTWCIDFEKTATLPVFSDMCKLEACLLMEYTILSQREASSPEHSVTLADLKAFVVALATISDLSRPLPPIHQVSSIPSVSEGSNPTYGVRLVYDTVAMVRKGLARFAEEVGPIDYALGMLYHSLRTLSYSGLQPHQYELAELSVVAYARAIMAAKCPDNLSEEELDAVRVDAFLSKTALPIHTQRQNATNDLFGVDFQEQQMKYSRFISLKYGKIIDPVGGQVLDVWEHVVPIKLVQGEKKREHMLTSSGDGMASVAKEEDAVDVLLPHLEYERYRKVVDLREKMFPSGMPWHDNEAVHSAKHEGLLCDGDQYKVTESEGSPTMHVTRCDALLFQHHVVCTICNKRYHSVRCWMNSHSIQGFLGANGKPAGDKHIVCVSKPGKLDVTFPVKFRRTTTARTTHLRCGSMVMDVTDDVLRSVQALEDFAAGTGATVPESDDDTPSDDGTPNDDDENNRVGRDDDLEFDLDGDGVDDSDDVNMYLSDRDGARQPCMKKISPKDYLLVCFTCQTVYHSSTCFVRDHMSQEQKDYLAEKEHLQAPPPSIPITVAPTIFNQNKPPVVCDMNVWPELPHNDRFVCLGGPAAGKSVLLKRLLVQGCKSQTKDGLVLVPVLIPIVDLSRIVKRLGLTHDDNLFDHYITEKYGQYSSRYQFLSLAYRRKQIFLLLDGLDEAATAKDPTTGWSPRQVIEAYILGRLETDGNRILLASRFSGFDQSKFSAWKLVILLPLNREMQLDLFQMRMPGYDVEAFTRELDTLDKNSREYVATPLLFSLFLAVYKMRVDEQTIASTDDKDGPPASSRANTVDPTAMTSIRRTTRTLLYEVGVKMMVRNLDAVKFRTRINAPGDDAEGSGGSQVLMRLLTVLAHDRHCIARSQDIMRVDITNLESKLIKARVEEASEDALALLSETESIFDIWENVEESVLAGRLPLLTSIRDTPDRNDAVLRFTHLTFQEYLAATYLVREFVSRLAASAEAGEDDASNFGAIVHLVFTQGADRNVPPLNVLYDPWFRQMVRMVTSLLPVDVLHRLVKYLHTLSDKKYAGVINITLPIIFEEHGAVLGGTERLWRDIQQPTLVISPALLDGKGGYDVKDLVEWLYSRDYGRVKNVNIDVTPSLMSALNVREKQSSQGLFASLIAGQLSSLRLTARGGHLKEISKISAVMARRTSTSSYEGIDTSPLASIDIEGLPFQEHIALGMLANIPDSVLTSVSLVRVSLPCESTAKLMEDLKGNKSITSLKIVGNGLDVSGGKQLAELLSVHPALTSVDVGYSQPGIGDEGLASIADVISKESETIALTELGVASNGIGVSGAAALGKALLARAMSGIDISANFLGDSGVIELLGPSVMRTNLRTVSLLGCFCGLRTTEAMVRAVFSAAEDMMDVKATAGIHPPNPDGVDMSGGRADQFEAMLRALCTLFSAWGVVPQAEVNGVKYSGPTSEDGSLAPGELKSLLQRLQEQASRTQDLYNDGLLIGDLFVLLFLCEQHGCSSAADPVFDIHRSALSILRDIGRGSYRIHLSFLAACLEVALCVEASGIQSRETAEAILHFIEVLPLAASSASSHRDRLVEACLTHILVCAAWRIVGDLDHDYSGSVGKKLALSLWDLKRKVAHSLCSTFISGWGIAVYRHIPAGIPIENISFVVGAARGLVRLECERKRQVIDSDSGRGQRPSEGQDGPLPTREFDALASESAGKAAEADMSKARAEWPYSMIIYAVVAGFVAHIYRRDVNLSMECQGVLLNSGLAGSDVFPDPKSEEEQIMKHDLDKAIETWIIEAPAFAAVAGDVAIPIPTLGRATSHRNKSQFEMTQAAMASMKDLTKTDASIDEDMCLSALMEWSLFWLAYGQHMLFFQAAGGGGEATSAAGVGGGLHRLVYYVHMRKLFLEEVLPPWMTDMSSLLSQHWRPEDPPLDPTKFPPSLRPALLAYLARNDSGPGCFEEASFRNMYEEMRGELERKKLLFNQAQIIAGTMWRRQFAEDHAGFVRMLNSAGLDGELHSALWTRPIAPNLALEFGYLRSLEEALRQHDAAAVSTSVRSLVTETMHALSTFQNDHFLAHEQFGVQMFAHDIPRCFAAAERDYTSVLIRAGETTLANHVGLAFLATRFGVLAEFFHTQLYYMSSQPATNPEKENAEAGGDDGAAAGREDWDSDTDVDIERSDDEIEDLERITGDKVVVPDAAKSKLGCVTSMLEKNLGADAWLTAKDTLSNAEGAARAMSYVLLAGEGYWHARHKRRLATALSRFYTKVLGHEDGYAAFAAGEESALEVTGVPPSGVSRSSYWREFYLGRQARAHESLAERPGILRDIVDGRLGDDSDPVRVYVRRLLEGVASSVDWSQE